MPRRTKPKPKPKANAKAKAKAKAMVHIEPCTLWHHTHSVLHLESFFFGIQRAHNCIHDVTRHTAVHIEPLKEYTYFAHFKSHTSTTPTQTKELFLVTLCLAVILLLYCC